MGNSISSLRIAAEGGAVSDRTRQLRDEEQQHLADQAMRMAVRIIREHRDKLDELALSLLRNEVLERDEIERIMADVKRPVDDRPAQGLRMVAASDAPLPAADAT
jgi:cell division protease FtsH